MPSGDTEKSLRRLEERVTAVAAGRRHPDRARGRSHDRPARRDRRRPTRRLGTGLGHPLRRPRRHRRFADGIALRSRHSHASADRVGRLPRRSLLADRTARLLARTGDAGLDGRAGDALIRDERDRGARSRRRAGRGDRRSPWTTATRSFSRSTSTWSIPVRPRAPARPNRAGSPVVNCSTPCAASRWRRRSAAWTSSRSRRPTTTPRSRPTWATAIVLEALGGIAWRRKSLRGDATRHPERSVAAALVAHRLEDLVHQFVGGVGVQERQTTDRLALPLGGRDEGDLIAQELMAPSV